MFVFRIFKKRAPSPKKLLTVLIEAVFSKEFCTKARMFRGRKAFFFLSYKPFFFKLRVLGELESASFAF